MPLLNSSGRYQLQKRLHGHQDAILSLGISKDGSFLASGGASPATLPIMPNWLYCEARTVHVFGVWMDTRQ